MRYPAIRDLRRLGLGDIVQQRREREDEPPALGEVRVVSMSHQFLDHHVRVHERIALGVMHRIVRSPTHRGEQRGVRELVRARHIAARDPIGEFDHALPFTAERGERVHVGVPLGGGHGDSPPSMRGATPCGSRKSMPGAHAFLTIGRDCQ